MAGNGDVLRVDCYGTHFTGDLVVTYYASGESSGFWEGERRVTEVDLYDDPAGLQPTPPRDFTCTNPQQIGAHPRFTWCAPEAPVGVGFRYTVYRTIHQACAWEEVASGLTLSEWTDEELEINPRGLARWYRVTANSGHSPESEPSNEVSVNGYLGKRVTDGPPGDVCPSCCAGLLVYPNPCNPVATVRYVLPEEGGVKVALYDLGGREVVPLAQGHHAAGEHQAQLDGRALASGVYLVRMLCGGRGAECQGAGGEIAGLPLYVPAPLLSSGLERGPGTGAGRCVLEWDQLCEQDRSPCRGNFW
ncbi:MAG: T9SS type A sorting domain-containing protein [candidate division KSB1 bacterium]|nr:T9SS type A sorting domain-containing protein [candidate division KSB1 bacterium]